MNLPALIVLLLLTAGQAAESLPPTPQPPAQYSTNPTEANASGHDALLPACTATPTPRRTPAPTPTVTPTPTKKPNGAPLDPARTFLRKGHGPYIYEEPAGSGIWWTAYMYELEADPVNPPGLRFWVDMKLFDHVVDWPGWTRGASYLELPPTAMPDGRKTFTIIFAGSHPLPTWMAYEIDVTPPIAATVQGIAPAPTTVLPPTGNRLYLPLVLNIGSHADE